MCVFADLEAGSVHVEICDDGCRQVRDREGK